jgi:hypothetical protein
VQLIQDDGAAQSVPVDLGSAMRLKFLHSIYDSQVEEIFSLQHDGFHLTQLRYGEARLVDFYGHDNANFDNGAWIVHPAPTWLPSLNLTTGAESSMSLHFENRTHLIIPAGGALRLTIESCKSSAHG